MFQHKRTRWLLAAAAAAVVTLVIGFWPDKAGRGPGSGIAWADVVQHVGAAKTMVCWGGHGASLRRYKCFSKGNKCRLEQFAAGVERGPTRIEISPAMGTEWDTVAWSPSRQRAWRQRASGCPSTYPQKPQASLWWANLQKIGADQTRRIGEVEINGVPAIVFEASAQSFFDRQPPALQEQGTLRVWVSKQSGAPIQIELRHAGGSGNEVVETASEMQWDAPMPDELFQAPPFDNTWKVEDSRTVCFPGNGQQGSLELGIGPRGGEPIATQGDLLMMRAVERIANTGNGPRLTISFELTDGATRRLQEYAKANVGRKLSATINGQAPLDLKTAPGNVPWPLDTEELAVSLDEFERTCFPRKQNE
jgi:hypothetical protein